MEKSRGLKKLQKLLGAKLHKDNRGGAMVMVLVVIMFISIIAAVLMFLAYLGYQMRLMDKQGKDTFYTAETVLDEINTGIQAEISDAMSTAYQDVMVNYSLYDTAQKRSSHFNELYINQLKGVLQGGSVDGCYDIAVLRGYLSDEIVGNSTGSFADGDRGSREKFGTFGAIVESNMTPDSYMLVTKTGESLLLKDLKVTYVNERGFVSIITTDIKIVLPELGFAQASELPALNNSCLIANETLAMGNVNAGSGVTIKGNAYAGRMTVGSTAENPAFLPASLVHFQNIDGADPDKLSLVVSREDITVNDSSIETENVELWGQNLLLTSAAVPAAADLDGSTNLRDDLVLEGAGSKVTLAGEYSGFGMITGDASGAGAGGAADEAADPALSSAIVVNGKDSLLDLSALTNLTIAGHSYVQTKVPYTGTEVNVEAENGNKDNVLMGESVALKSNQLVYLVPAEALGCIIEEDGSIGDSVYASNPLTLEQYEEIKDHSKYLMIDGNRQIEALGYKTLNNYINKETVVGETEKLYMPEVIFKHTSAGTLVYCYLRFADEEKANQYFRDYYRINAEEVFSYTRLYAKEIKMPDPTTMVYLNLGGNMLVYSQGQTDPATVLAAPDDGQSSYYSKHKQAKSIYNTKTSVFKALSAKMVTDDSQLTIPERSRYAFENIIDEAKVQEILNAAMFDTVQMDTNTPGNIKSAILTRKADYTVDASAPDQGIIVSLGNVEVRKDFKGLILAKGNITVTSAGGITIEPMSINDFSETFEAKKDFGGTEYSVIDVFRDGISYNSVGGAGAGGAGGAGAAAGTNSTIAPVDLIIYERWTKK
ncbi:MAG: hypothetical protein NC318_02230 [Blautia sp.]|nr:hypothetical protein [Lachnoclostridium sp.]MCM1210398.1 hypothetical protein [Blautia sp.]